MEETLRFPPLFWAETTKGDPFEHACMRATAGCEAGLVAYNLSNTNLQAALVFAPEVALNKAMAMLPVCGIGFQNALGALAPPEVAVHLGWNGSLWINGAACGRLKVASATQSIDETPDWLVVGLELPLLPEDDAPGIRPDKTSLFAEGCADVSPSKLLEAWARHTLTWITRWDDEGTRPIFNEWRGLAHGLGEDVEQQELCGTFMGVDEDFGMLLRLEDETRLIPLTEILENLS